MLTIKPSLYMQLS